jgi:hypothetical protein
MKYNMARKLGNFKLSHIENYYYSLVDKWAQTETDTHRQAGRQAYRR